MAVLTESSLRSHYFKQKLKESILKLPKGTIITPSAKSYLKEKKITVKMVEEEIAHNPKKDSSIDEEPKKDNNLSPLFQSNKTVLPDEFPDYLTPHHSNFHAFKDYERIVWLSEMDALQAKIIETQYSLSYNVKLTRDLAEILTYIRRIIHLEEHKEPLETLQLLGLDETEIRSIASDPKRYFGIDYFYPDYQLGKEIVLLNSLRTDIRKIELLVYQLSQKEENAFYFKEVLLALNLLTSICWIIMLKSKTGLYNEEAKR